MSSSMVGCLLEEASARPWLLLFVDELGIPSICERRRV
jgi:hypothetical protein